MSTDEQRDTRSRAEVIAAAAKRMLLWQGLSRFYNMYLVTEFPRSGGSWVCQMLSDYLALPYIRNASPRLEPSVLHGHHKHSPTMHNAGWVLRDGRDVTVSLYYHSLFHNDRNVPSAVEHARQTVPFVDYDDIRSNLPLFIQYIFEGAGSRRLSGRLIWTEFVDSWLSSSAPMVRYEDLLADPVPAFTSFVSQLTGEAPDVERATRAVERFSFTSLTSRAPGEQDKAAFIRKGVAGEWREHFSPLACQVFDHYAGATLVAAGYESSRSWKLAC